MVRRTPGETVRATYNEETRQVVRIGAITEAVLGEYPDATLGRVTPAERAALEVGCTTNVGNVIVVPVNTACEMDDVQAVRLDESFSMLCGHRRPDGAVLAAAFCFREPRFSVHEAEDMVVRWGYAVQLAQASPEPQMLTCPSCGAQNEMDAQSCTNCGSDGPPFDTPMHMRQQPQQPLALHVTVNGNEVDARQIGKYVYVTCPECGLVQDATHAHCSRCAHNLAPETKKLLGDPNRPPETHLKPPPPANEQIDLREPPAP